MILISGLLFFLGFFSGFFSCEFLMLFVNCKRGERI